ncbi:transcription elongation regulator [Kickxella alabastrina]|nr:transcription elongation regulator [Kickxella alabastrina]
MSLVHNNQATKHDWAQFFAPGLPIGRHLPNEPYYYERTNGITTWIRPFDYIEPPNPKQLAEDLCKEHEQQKAQEARKKALQDRPQKTTKAQAGWLVVDTVQGRQYYFNEKSGVAQWERPDELVELADVEENEEGVEMDEEDAEWMLEQMMAEAQGDQQDGAEIETEETGKEVGAEAEAEALTKDQRVGQFREMLLAASSLNPFGTWESQKDRFLGDRRLQYLGAAEQHDMFDRICSEIIAQRKKTLPKKDEVKRPLPSSDPFGQLLEENISKRGSFAKFCQKHLRDPRYLSIKTSREREKRFNQHLDALPEKKHKHV